jgi:hypothetical protein
MKGIKALLLGVASLAVTPNAVGADTGSTPTTTKIVHDRRVTHLNVLVGEIVNLESFCVAQDGGTSPLIYDRSSKPLVIPSGYSFVVTDIIAYPFCTGSPDANARWHFILEGPKARRFVGQFRGDSTTHYALSGGLAYTSDNVPAIRMVRDPVLSLGSIDMQVLGYFVRGNAIAPEASRF